MSRLSFEKKRPQQPVAAHPAAVSVRVLGADRASVGGTAVAAAPGEEIQQAVLNHLQRLAISLGAPIRATIHDDRAGCVVPLEVSPDGSSRVAGKPERLAPQEGERRASVPHQAFTADIDVPPASLTPTPARGFDAVAEEVLAEGPPTGTAQGAEFLAEPTTRINEAVRAGRIEVAAQLVGRTVAEATAVLGAEHAGVLRLRELDAYIAYLAGDPVRACRLSLNLARMRRHARDAEAAYGNVQSAATAWRAVRDPEEGLRLGRDLIALWTDLSAEPGPAADDPHPLESARARMIRLTDRAAKAATAAQP
ncbi:hypothetical protein ACGFYV_07525 [Streptomyces sp. NPDC048297]|uniref:hypothetical protein n=1 Tax=Streptomyces sp. NPDC048297 TaxID=3365531 RepID=UPI003716CFB0